MESLSLEITKAGRGPEQPFQKVLTHLWAAFCFEGLETDFQERVSEDVLLFMLVCVYNDL